MNIVNWLEPVIWNPTTRSFHRNEPFSPAEEARTAETPHTSELRAGEVAEDHSGFNLAHAIESKLHNETATEWLFIIISLVVQNGSVRKLWNDGERDTRANMRYISGEVCTWADSS